MLVLIISLLGFSLWREQQRHIQQLDEALTKVSQELNELKREQNRRWLQERMVARLHASHPRVWYRDDYVVDLDLSRPTFPGDLRLLKLPTAALDEGRGAVFSPQDQRVLDNLRTLRLSGTRMGDAGLEHLKELDRLENLYLDGTQVTDAGLEHLRELTSLTLLDLSDTQVTGPGLGHLKGLTGLRYLHFHHNQVTEEGVKKLKEALPNCEIIVKPLP